MNEPQVWVLIGVFTTIMLGGMTLMTTLITRATSVAVEGLRGEMNARFDTVETKIDHLDRDVTFLMRRAWGEPRGE
ncbi:hypothetical protein ACH3VR_13285 [Microbacterium sp. B2969]|uniref:Uncharacterized protein n=1 Tax=Microbacterium alkaliflavum TaxID=3248839 RepID=A0ABW7QD05_9MICO